MLGAAMVAAAPNHASALELAQLRSRCEAAEQRAAEAEAMLNESQSTVLALTMALSEQEMVGAGESRVSARLQAAVGGGGV